MKHACVICGEPAVVIDLRKDGTKRKRARLTCSDDCRREVRRLAAKDQMLDAELSGKKHPVAEHARLMRTSKRYAKRQSRLAQSSKTPEQLSYERQRLREWREAHPDEATATIRKMVQSSIAKRRAATTCKRGHSDWVVKASGKRRCRVCLRAERKRQDRKRRAPKPELRPCVICGKDYRPKTNNSRNNTCRRRSCYNARAAQYQQAKAATFPPRACDECGETFTPRRRTTRLCSQRCVGLDTVKRRRAA